MELTWPDPLPARDGVLLRPPRDSDLPLVAELATDPYVPTIGTVPHPYSDEAGSAYIARQHQRLTDGTGWSFVIADAEDDRPLGQIGLWIRELPAGRATAGYAISPSARGRGVATAALLVLTDFAWTVPGLHRVELYIEPWNTGSLRAAANAGYTREGLLRSHQAIAGTRRDMVLCAAVHATEQPAGPRRRLPQPLPQPASERPTP